MVLFISLFVAWRTLCMCSHTGICFVWQPEVSKVTDKKESIALVLPLTSMTNT